MKEEGRERGGKGVREREQERARERERVIRQNSRQLASLVCLPVDIKCVRQVDLGEIFVPHYVDSAPSTSRNLLLCY